MGRRYQAAVAKGDPCIGKLAWLWIAQAVTDREFGFRKSPIDEAKFSS